MIYSLPRADDGILTVHDEARIPLGECYYSSDDNAVWTYLRAEEALVRGEAVRSKPIGAVGNGLAAGGAPAGGHTITDADGGFNAALARVPTNGAKFGQSAIIVVTDGTGKGQRGTVLKYIDTELTIYWHDSDQGTLTTALDTDSDYQFVVPWLVNKAVAGSGVVAFAQTAVKLGEYFWGLCEGEGWALAASDIAAGVTLQVGGTAGPG